MQWTVHQLVSCSVSVYTCTIRTNLVTVVMLTLLIVAELFAAVYTIIWFLITMYTEVLLIILFVIIGVLAIFTVSLRCSVCLYMFIQVPSIREPSITIFIHTMFYAMSV